MASIASSPSIANAPTQPPPHPTVAQVDNCQFHKWYHLPNIRKYTIRSMILPMSKEFVDYLNEDGINLPNVPDGMPVSPFDPRYVKSDKDDDGEWDDFEGEEAEENFKQHCFPAFEKNINDAIEALGGKVFVKMNWSSPKDAKWVSGTLECQTPGEVYLLLKSSDFVSYDLAHAYDLVQDVDKKAEIQIEASCSKKSSFYLVLRRWGNLYPSQEFRCFVKQKRLILSTQRDPTKCYPFLMQQKEAYKDLIETFFSENIVDVYPDDSYSFDVYIDRKKRVWLLDFNVFSRATDALLYTWDEILRAPIEGPEPLHELRLVRDESQLRSSQLSMHKVPAEFVNNPKNFIEEFVEKCRNGGFGGSSDSSDETE